MSRNSNTADVIALWCVDYLLHDNWVQETSEGLWALLSLIPSFTFWSFLHSDLSFSTECIHWTYLELIMHSEIFHSGRIWCFQLQSYAQYSIIICWQTVSLNELVADPLIRPNWLTVVIPSEFWLRLQVEDITFCLLIPKNNEGTMERQRTDNQNSINPRLLTRQSVGAPEQSAERSK